MLPFMLAQANCHCCEH